MRLTGMITALVALVFASCQKPTAENNDSAPDLPSATPAPLAAEPVAPVAPTAPVAVIPPTRETAPPGRYFLRRRISVETDSGIAGYVPGAFLQQTAPGKYRALDGRVLTLAAADVTNDLAEARALAGHDAAAQAALARHATSAITAPAAAAAPVAQSAPPAVVRAVPPAAPASAPLGGGSALNRGSYGETKAFVDTDGDGRKFDTRQKSRLK